MHPATQCAHGGIAPCGWRQFHDTEIADAGDYCNHVSCCRSNCVLLVLRPNVPFRVPQWDLKMSQNS